MSHTYKKGTFAAQTNIFVCTLYYNKVIYKKLQNRFLKEKLLKIGTIIY